MGGFFYASKEAGLNTSEIVTKSRQQFQDSGFKSLITFDTASYTIDYYPKIDCEASNCVAFPGGDFIFAVGTFIYRGLIGADALQLFYLQSNYRNELLASHGHYVIVLRKNGRTELFKDPMGSHDVFLTRDAKCATTSFLAAASSVPQCTINVQETYEYVFTGVSLGTSTPFAEIRRLALPEQMILEPGPSLGSERVDTLPNERGGSFDALAERNLRVLLDYASDLAKLFGNKIRLALSGGFDSRLLLALFRHSGVTPRLFVYGSKNDKDVRMAGQITRAEGLDLDHVDKTLLRQIEPDQYPDVVRTNFHCEDALPNGGIFTNGAELIARRARNENGALHVNGGGGEIFRNFFNLPAGTRLSPRQFVWTFYSRFDPPECTAVFDAKTYEEKIARKVTALLDVKGRTLSRRQVESIYPYFRCRSWFGRENSVNSRWGYSVLPFFDHQIVREALRIPIRYKYFGNFEACLIRMADPALAGHISNYGYNFARSAPMSAALAGRATYLRPAWLRRYTFRLKARMEKRRPRPQLLTEPYLAQVIDTKFPYMAKFFNVNKVKSDLHFARLCTLEYLYSRVSALAVP